jgi:hypothetical protein
VAEISRPPYCKPSTDGHEQIVILSENLVLRAEDSMCAEILCCVQQQPSAPAQDNSQTIKAVLGSFSGIQSGNPHCALSLLCLSIKPPIKPCLADIACFFMISISNVEKEPWVDQ